MRFLIVIPLFAVIGCGGNNSVLTGHVSHHGKPLTAGTVVVLNPDQSAAKGEIAADGSYRVTGVGRGAVKVGVLCPNPDHHIARPVGSRKKRPPTRHTAGWEPVSDKVGNPNTSGIGFQVAGSETHDIVVP